MYQMKHDLLTQPRADVIGIRNARLADSMDRMHQATQAHGPVKGPRFMALHTRCDNMVDAVDV
jgi:DNA-binding ferritin-like protein